METQNSPKKTTVIITGQFSEGGASKGNFTGWDDEGTQIYITKKMMLDTFGVDTQPKWIALNATGKVMFDCIYKENVTFNVVDKDNKPVFEADGVTPKTFTQEARATAIFKERADFVKARNSKRMQEVDVEAGFVKSVKESGLDTETVARLLNFSNFG